MTNTNFNSEDLKIDYLRFNLWFTNLIEFMNWINTEKEFLKSEKINSNF